MDRCVFAYPPPGIIFFKTNGQPARAKERMIKSKENILKSKENILKSKEKVSEM